MKKNFLEVATVFPFAYGPEYQAARQVLSNDVNELVVKFDMSRQVKPECAAVAMIFSGESHPKENYVIDLSFEGDELELSLELKSGANKLKYSEMLLAPGKNVISGVLPETSEIVICCFRSGNEGKKATVKLIVD